MSDDALGWARHHQPSKPRAKELLKQLAAYADAEGVTWAAVGTLGEEMQLKDRQVQVLLRLLEAEGYIVRTGRFHHRNVPFYQLALGWDGPLKAIREARKAGVRVADPVAANGALECTLQDANGALECTPNGALQCTLINRELTSGANAPSARAGASEIDPVFEAVFVAWIDACPGRVSRKLAWPAWLEASRRVDPARIMASARRYLTEDDQVRRLGPMALHRWLAEDRWEPWLADPAPLGRARWPGPGEIRAGLAAAKGDDFAGSWLDRCGWDGERRAVLTRTGLARDALRRALTAPAWAALGVEIIEKGS
jgi:hypothetical protein